METLSDKRIIIEGTDYPDFIKTKDVKDFIKKLKEEINKFSTHRTGVHKGFLCGKIDALAGDKLT